MFLRPGICTVSLGRSAAGHSLSHKLMAASQHGFEGIDLLYEDLHDFAEQKYGSSCQDHELRAAQDITFLCQELKLEIICLQPFMHFGGRIDRETHQQDLVRLQHWTQLCQILKTDLIVFPSSFLSKEKLSTDTSTVVSDMIDAADLGSSASPPIRFALEALCWGTNIDTWDASWDVVRYVNKPNFGICLDTFNIAGRVFADPTQPNGCVADAVQALQRSLHRLMGTVDSSKVFMVQTADAEKLSSPLNPSHPFHHKDQPARMSWSRNARLFYGEEKCGSYLPIRAIHEAIVHGLGYKGWVSFEVFNRALFDTDPELPDTIASRASKSWTKLIRHVNQDEDRSTTSLL
ncbi:hypothetical protein VHEMI09116 [[Torrubiella] hemipterigena]|uniref:Xylose isomerase-like TIM barrel domain-containing protein n=1 Tax=[Torrubiella] hemipterigena TaxID=1531966 RepID=A0A0A1TPF9_9HYPO|nr:hypothetical protein VHEMI09116 [[Torrubiella] hemipterigena]